MSLVIKTSNLVLTASEIEIITNLREVRAPYRLTIISSIERQAKIARDERKKQSVSHLKIVIGGM